MKNPVEGFSATLPATRAARLPAEKGGRLVQQSASEGHGTRSEQLYDKVSDSNVAELSPVCPWLSRAE
jgi:hypothetical protein